MDQNIESEILEKHKLCKVLKVYLRHLLRLWWYLEMAMN